MSLGEESGGSGRAAGPAPVGTFRGDMKKIPGPSFPAMVECDNRRVVAMGSTGTAGILTDAPVRPLVVTAAPTRPVLSAWGMRAMPAAELSTTVEEEMASAPAAANAPP